MINIKNKAKDSIIKLSLKEHDDRITSKVQKEILKEELDKFHSIKENDVNISTSYVFEVDNKLEVNVFFRNGTVKEINFDKVPLSLIDENNEIVSNKIFNLRELGNIPPKSARPYKVYFDKVDGKIPNNKWKVIFDNNLKAISTVNVELEGSDNSSIRYKVEEYIEKMSPIEKGQVSISNYKIELKDETSIKIDVLVRNGSDKKIKLEKLPVTVWDKNNKKMFSIVLDINSLEVSPFKARLYSLIINFEKEKFNDYNLEKLYVDFKKE